MNEQTLKHRLQIISKEKNIHFNECWKKLLLERFLFRLSCSSYAKKFIFKGGFLLNYFIEIGRETTDLDFLLTKMQSSEAIIKQAILEILAIPSIDGFSFTYDNIQSLRQPHMNYPGYRISLKASFGMMKDKVHIDIGIGDIVTPSNYGLHLFEYQGKPLFESDISLKVYPPETIFAEKLETILSKGSANSRMKDYHDLILLIRHPHILNFTVLPTVIKKTFTHRGTLFELIQFSSSELTSINKLWSSHVHYLGSTAYTLHLPLTIQEVIQEINHILAKHVTPYIEKEDVKNIPALEPFRD